MTEAGHYSIAGFFFQLLASASDAMRLYFCEEGKGGTTAVFSLEKLGQDGVVTPVCGDNGKTRLIQYKYSSVGAKIDANDMRSILDAFRRSVEASKRGEEEFEYQLRTNRELDDNVRKWFTDRNSIDRFKEHLHKNLSRESVRQYPHSRLHQIFSRLSYKKSDLDSCKSEIESIGNSHGMDDCELKTGIMTVIGYLLEIARLPGDRKVIRELLIEHLLGRKKPLSLTGKESLEIQRQAILDFKNQETQYADTIERELYREIAEKAMRFPFVVVQGEGGCGKSVAMCEAAKLNLESPNDPPGFAFVIKAAELDQTSIQVAVKSWRNQTDVPDQLLWKHTIERLERARRVAPVLAVYVDGIDERHGLQGLPPDSRDFLNELIFEATKSFRVRSLQRLSVVVSCRNKSDLRGISRGGFDFAEEPVQVLVSEFEFAELLEIANSKKIDGTVSRRIDCHIQLRLNGADFRGPSGDAAVSPEHLNYIRHPIFWRCFAKMSVYDQHRYLDGESGSLRVLAEEYVQWFKAKVEERIGGIALDAIRTLPIIAQRFSNNHSRIGSMRTDWIDPCIEAGCPRIHIDTVFNEAASAGMIEKMDEAQKTWRWKRPWLCSFLANGNIAND